ncbi:MAG: hypothetical protein ABSF18_01525 [Gammaproteobacteria bacterium]|jgi:hypothetical protein
MLTIARIKTVYQHYQNHGFKSTVNFVLARLKNKVVVTTQEAPPVTQPYSSTVKQMLNARFGSCNPLRVYLIPRNGAKRLTMVTDSVNVGFYGGVGTAIIFAALLAEARQSRLRILTRADAPRPENVAHILAAYNIKLSYEIEFVFADPGKEIDIFDDEIFIPTIWWTTAATMASIRHDLIIWLLQDDERMFYPNGDDYLRCEQIIQSKTIRFVVNTKLLFDHLIHQFPQIEKNGLYFEPAFPPEIFHQRPKNPGDKLTLMFYARPNNVRNLFYYGLELIEEAITRGIIDLSLWDIILVGKDIPEFTFSEQYVPKKYENLQWKEYAKIIGQVDLGLCLMHTPHPSYPPLDLAASGAVVVTNGYGNKKNLEFYSKNIICSDLDKESMLNAFAEGVALATNFTVRKKNFQANTLEMDWRHSLSSIIKEYERTL